MIMFTPTNSDVVQWGDSNNRKCPITHYWY